jgi:crotonobetainyl-CoA:carnitine CoA-transferase CaiB-like acyl-CoA transferase
MSPGHAREPAADAPVTRAPFEGAPVEGAPFEGAPIEGAPIGGAPLAGVRVLDFSRVLAGPYCTMLLADMGADVIKVERPGDGDETRTWGPPFAGGEATYYLSLNRGKRSIALDLADPRAKPVVQKLARTSDVVVENFRAGVAERLGVGYEAVRALRQDIVYCSITGFGSRREPRGRPGYDFIVQAESGLMSITGDRDGPPTKAGVALVDVLCGVHAAVGILAALTARERSGRGRRLEVSLLDAALGSLVNVAQAALATGEEAGRYGNAHPSIVPYEPFETASGWIAVAAANDGLWRRLCEAIEREDLLADERLATNPGRVEHRDELVRALAGTFYTRTAEEWLSRLDAHGVPAGKVRGVREAFEAAAAAGEGASVIVGHPTIGELALVRGPIRVDPKDHGDALPAPTAPPLLGQHTVEVLGQIGVDPGALIAAGVAAVPPARPGQSLR